MRDLIDLMREAADKLESEVEKAERLALLKENEMLRDRLEHAEVVRANALGLLRRLGARNGTEADDIRRHKEILATPFLRRSA